MANTPKFISFITNRITPEARKQIMRYLVTGFTAFGIEYALYVMVYRVLGLHYILASSLVYAVVFWFVFLMNRYWSFESKGDIIKQLIQYGLLFCFNLGVANVCLMYLLTDILGISPFISPVIRMGFIVCWNFFVYKFIIYK